jgi:hypothetical protein
MDTVTEALQRFDRNLLVPCVEPLLVPVNLSDMEPKFSLYFRRLNAEF